MQLFLDMLSNIFISVFNMSITASVIVAFVFFARLCLKRMPRGFSYALWAVVLFRLLCPISFELPVAALSLTGASPADEVQMSTMQYIESDWMLQQSKTDSAIDTPADTGNASDGAAVVPNESTAATTQDMTATNDGAQGISFDVVTVASAIWLLGAVGLFGANCFSLLRLKKKLRGAAWHSIAAQSGGTTVPYWSKRKGTKVCIYQSDAIPTAFVLGVLRPCIYLPAHLSLKEQSYILQHEQTHIARRDPLWQALAFLALCLHWFNPLVWLAFKANQKDMELSCDERVLRQMGSEIKKEYAQSLLNLSQGKNAPLHHVLAFGESSAKSRIKNVLSYRKPVFWVSCAASLALVVAAILLVANPMPNVESELQTAGDAIATNSTAADGTTQDDTPTQTTQSLVEILYGTIEITPAERETLFADLEEMDELTSEQLAPSEAILVYAIATEAAVLVPFADAADGERAWLEMALIKQNDTWQVAQAQDDGTFGATYFTDSTKDAATQLWSEIIRNGSAPYDQYVQYIDDADGDGVAEIFGFVTSSSLTAPDAVPSVLWCYHDRTYEKIGAADVFDVVSYPEDATELSPQWVDNVDGRAFYCMTLSGTDTLCNVYSVQDGEVIAAEPVTIALSQEDLADYFITSITERYGEDNSMVSDDAMLTLTDLDKDGNPELWMMVGTYQATTASVSELQEDGTARLKAYLSSLPDTTQMLADTVLYQTQDAELLYMIGSYSSAMVEGEYITEYFYGMEENALTIAYLDSSIGFVNAENPEDTYHLNTLTDSADLTQAEYEAQKAEYLQGATGSAPEIVTVTDYAQGDAFALALQTFISG